MNKYSLVGINPTRIVHSGAINGELPTISGEPAEPTVSAGLAKYNSLTTGGLFAFDKKAIIVEALIGTFTIVDSDDGATVIRPTPTTFPFKLFPGEWLKASSGASVTCVVRLDAQRIL
jgi:hypothetical protein